ncbi:MAG TPA: transaldolase, partial [Gammaproteobacteria bacterium]|nr:transaldolase [Gammaproteobacteria bacterium]
MSKNPLSQLSDFGQSFWYDNIQRSLLLNGEMKKMIDEDDVRGVTSNPSIFEKAIANSNDYDQSLMSLVSDKQKLNSREAFFSLAIEDIQMACDLLKPVYDKTQAVDGYVSLEVSPDLAHDTEASIKEAQALFIRLARPNAMIKIPATQAGIPVIERLVADGINVNATLLFSAERYIEVAKAYIRGLTARHQRGLPIDNIASVASFFMSRVDVKLDQCLAKVNDQESATLLMGKMGIINAKIAYLEFLDLFESDEFKALQKAGAHPQRLLWASTGTKNPALSDVLYVESLIGENTV